MDGIKWHVVSGHLQLKFGTAAGYNVLIF